jgi:hypothetical protein
MKRMTIRVVLIAWVAGLLVVISPFRGRQLDIMPRVHAQEGCSVATLQGADGFYRTGTTPVGPLAAVGIATFDGQGNTSARQTIRKNGVTTSDLFADPPLLGLYQVDADCAGRFLTPDSSVFAHIVIADGGKELGISLSTGNTVSGV